MTPDSELYSLLEEFVAHHERGGAVPCIEHLCRHRPELVASLQALIDTYLDVAQMLEPADVSICDLFSRDSVGAAPVWERWPVFEGFQTIERLGLGGMGEVFKLRDLRLDRLVAAKVVRRRSAAAVAVGNFLREARALALFQDRRIVQVYEFRPEANPPVIIMEYVDGFELGFARRLDVRQRAGVLLDVCEAIAHAHSLGLQHRDLKPSNIMLDKALTPKILDFGLSTGDPFEGYFIGTLAYLAPEQLDPGAPLDARIDVYALGVILYELLCGCMPYEAARDVEVIAAIRQGRPRLPVEVDPTVPAPLQAIALKAMELDPAHRYPSAAELARDLRRYLDGRPVQARPTVYASALEARARSHVEQIGDWLRLKLIHPHEADHLRAAYAGLDAREDDWIVEGRALSYSQIALYFGAFLLVLGSGFYFAAHRVYDAVTGVARPFLVLAMPFIGLNVAAYHLQRRNHRVVAVAFYTAGVGLLPLFLLILFYESGIWALPSTAPGQLLAEAEISNRQLQATILTATIWCGWLAARTGTMALSTLCTVLIFFFAVAVLGDFGIRTWVEDGRFDWVALHLGPLVVWYGAAGALLERARQKSFCRPFYTAAAVLLVIVLELFALDGRALAYFGISLRGLQKAGRADPILIDTLAAMTVNGIAMYAVASALERRGAPLMQPAARLLFVLSPFAMLQPVGWLSRTGDYALGFDWLYTGTAVAITILSHKRQRKSFYYAGLLNTGIGLFLLADHRGWMDGQAWSIAVIALGLVALGVGFWLYRIEKRV
jgi:serine/threonine protein kinase